jgi:hypothetical protein
MWWLSQLSSGGYLRLKVCLFICYSFQNHEVVSKYIEYTMYSSITLEQFVQTSYHSH